MINTKRPNTNDYTQVGFIEAKDGQGNYQNIDHIYDSEGNIVFQQGYLNEYDGADNFRIPAIGKPLIDYTIYGNTFQDGIPTSDDPIMPEGTGDRTGNLFDIEKQTVNNRLVTLLDFGEDKNYPLISLVFEFSNAIAKEKNAAFIDLLEDNGTHHYITLKALRLSSTGGMDSFPLNEVVNNTYYASFTNISFRYVRMYLYTTSYCSFSQGDIKTAIYNTKRTDYEPYGYKLPIMAGKYEFLEEPLRAVKTYKDTIDLGTKLLTRQIKELVLTGEEAWQLWNGNYFSNVIDRKGAIATILCTHFINSNTQGISYDGVSIAALKIASVAVPFVTSVNDLKAWLAAQYTAGTPVTIWYVLAEPTTETISIPSGLTGIIEGVGIQDGTPTPDKPIMSVGKGEKTGNLLNLQEMADAYPNDTSFDGTTFDVYGGTTNLFNRGITVDFPSGCYFSCIPLEKENASTNGRVRFIYTDDTVKEVYITKNDGTPSVGRGELEKSVKSLRLNWTSFKSGFKFKLAIVNTGSTPLPYEPYGYKIPISSANTTVPVYLGEVETTRRVKKLVLTGEETLTSGSVIGQIRTPLTGAIDSLGLCTHYILKTSYGGAFPYIRIRSNTLWFEISPDGYETKEEALTDFKSYLQQQYAAGTPVTVWYVLATEQTAVVNDPLMRIGDYADSVDFSQAGVQIPTLKRPNTTEIDITTSLPPSEVYAKYRGSKTQKYDLFLAANGDSFEAKNGQSLYIGDDT